MKVIYFLCGLFCIAVAFSVTYCLSQILSGTLDLIPEMMDSIPKMMDSITDKIFWVLMLGGVIVIFAFISVAFLQGSSMYKKDIFSSWIIAPFCAIIVGAVYLLVFGVSW